MKCLQPVDLSKKLRLAHGVVCGMEYLHSVQPDPVVHGDLKTQNVLVADGLIAKVCITRNSSGDETANVNFLRRHRTMLQNIICC